MPEGNEIHRWAERHAVAFAGKAVRVDGPQGRFRDSDVLNGRKLARVMAVGKHLGYDFGKDRILHVHLGLQGDFTEGSGPLPDVRGAVRLRMWNAAAIKRPAEPGVSKRHGWYSSDDGAGHIAPEKIAWVELRGPMDCTVYTQAQWEKLLKRLGPDPLNGDRPERMIEKVRKSKKAIAEMLMDQSVVAGVGNIIRAELLFRARLSPFTAGTEVEEKTLRSIWKDAAALLKAGMVDRRIVSTKPTDRPHRKGKVLKEEAHYVYRRKGLPCFVCGTEVRRQEMAGRNLFWCPGCQA
ncbi:formamidopyrimidine-DNA glycosylase [Edaphobacter acidisoli]|uniref:DNA-(apurinic or apyrimidinic site) lyase n=1 Tax=Edaphobacter acidisoli TaxID=2040573 RepID=A0A916RWV0_9BACT|nr:Fpg/Nei family DNA glycosylase [Edaphobacter acidisoli]GGA74902.1 formamidopyrimidine-DNA glycosylase [Edaphobacter acidisoli]